LSTTTYFIHEDATTILYYNLVHGLDQVVNEVFTVTGSTALDEVVELALGPHVVRVGKLEGPQEVVGFTEVGTNCGDFVDQVFDTDDVVLAQSLFNDGVVTESDALLVDLGISTLVDEFTDGLEVGFTVGNIGFNQLEHFSSGLVEADKDTVVDLEKTQQLEDLARLGSNVVDTTDTDNEDKLGLGFDIVVTVGLGLTTETNLVAFVGLVFLVVLGSAVEDFTTLLDLGLCTQRNRLVKSFHFHPCK
jgi:hypothetical protein